MGRDIFEIASMFLGIAVLTLLINRSSDTVAVAQGVGGVFNGLLKTVTLQNGYSNPIASGSSLSF